MAERMKGIDGGEYVFQKDSKYDGQSSKLHKAAVSLIREMYPVTPVSEEVSIKISRAQTLYLDIYLPTFRVAVEVHGRQHRNFVPHFHKTSGNFKKSTHRDALKSKWCEINEIILIELMFDESKDDWRRKIRETIG